MVQAPQSMVEDDENIHEEAKQMMTQWAAEYLKVKGVLEKTQSPDPNAEKVLKNIEQIPQM